MAKREIKIEVTQITYEQDGKTVKFDGFKTYQKNGKKLDVRFTQAVSNRPRENCMIIVDDDNMNIDNSRKYPILWVKAIDEIKPIELKHKPEDYKDLEDRFETYEL